MRALTITPNLPVADIGEARAFYQDFLGLSVEEFNLGWVARYTCPETGANVQLVTRDATAAEDSVISVHSDDVDAAYLRASDLGYEIVHPLTTEPWGVRRFFVRAPDGTVVNIVRHREPEPDESACDATATGLVEHMAAWGEAHPRPPASLQTIRACEASLGEPLPGELRALLTEADGVDGEFGLGLVWPAQRIADDNVAFRGDELFAELYMSFDDLVFFSDAGNGDQFAVNLRGNHSVFVWNHEDDSRTWVAPTVRAFLEDWMTGRLAV